jgi:ATP-dependent HslUV protease ATP-binding subunit HslU
MPSNRTEQALARLADLTPRKIVAELDRYIVGQGEAKKAIAIALRNRWRRQRTPESIREEIAPNNIILIGPTGVGKTEIARRLAKLAGAPFIKVEASKFTEVGYVGRDVESMVRDLVESAIDMVRHERETEVDDLANDRVDERILDLLLPPPADALAAQALPAERVFVASSAGTATEDAASVRDRHKRTRDKLKQLLLDGQLEQREVEIEVTQQSPQLIDMMSQQGAGEGMGNLGEMLSELMPKKKKKRTVTVTDARRILLDEEFEKLINFDDVVTDALERVEQLELFFWMK